MLFYLFEDPDELFRIFISEVVNLTESLGSLRC